jgi:hypothetical protein
MNRTKFLSAIVVIAITISLVSSVDAEPLRGGKLAHGPGGFIRVLMNLDLSQDQKQTSSKQTGKI